MKAMTFALLILLLVVAAIWRLYMNARLWRALTKRCREADDQLVGFIGMAAIYGVILWMLSWSM